MVRQPEVVHLYERSVEAFLSRVRAVPDGAWTNSTPCADWDVRTLVNHVVGEDRWVEPLMAGRTIEDVGSGLDGDLLGEAPKATAEDAGKVAMASFAEPGALERTVALSFGDTSAEEYAWQLVADHVVHAWDLAVATNGERELDEDLVAAVTGWWEQWEEAYREAGAVDGAREVPPSASHQDRLIASFGRDPAWTGPRAT